MTPQTPATACVQDVTCTWSYTRVSDDREGESTSVTEQDDEISEDIAGAFPGGIVARRYSDPDRSASRFALKASQRGIEGAEPDRPEWQRMQRDLRSMPVPDVIAFWESSRSAREMGPWVRFLDYCRLKGILLRFVVDKRTYDPRNHADRSHLLDEGKKAEAASEDTSRRVRRRLRSAARAGRPHGPRLYGYLKERDYKGRLTGLAPDPGEAAVVLEVHERVAVSEPLIVIAEDLDARGILPPRAAAAFRELGQCDNPARRKALEAQIEGARWSPATIRGIIANQAYDGVRVHKGEIAGKAIWPAIVPAELAAQARGVIAGRRQSRERPGAGKYLLSYFAECGVCETPLQGLPAGDWRKAAVYSCMAPGRHSARLITLLDEYITEAIIARLSRDDMTRRVHATAGHADEIRRLLADADEKEQRLTEATTSHALHNKPSLRILTQMEDELTPLIKRDRERARHLGVNPLLRKLTGTEEAVRAAWETLSIAQRRKIIRLLILKIRLIPTGRRKNRPLRDTVQIEWAQEADKDA